jgi:hypothetical protein
MVDPITFGAGVSESGVAGVSFPELGVGVWYKGIPAPVAASRELAREPGVARTLAEEGGRTTVAAVAPSGLQARIIFEGVWDVILLDSFETVTVPIPDCSLVLELYEADGETLAWEVGTSPYHPTPYLCLPGNYGAQEIDIIAGAATIGQVEVTVIDKAQTPGDQDSGWLTERLVSGSIPAIQGRRCRLIRYISAALGYVVIADGYAGTPRMDESFSAYKWVIKDTREVERDVGAFGNSNVWIVPRGVEAGWGAYNDEAGDPQWLISPTEPLVGTYRESWFSEGVVSLEDYWLDPFTEASHRFPSTKYVLYDSNPLDVRVEIPEDFRDLSYSTVESLGGGMYRHTWPNLRMMWRAEGSEDPWNIVDPYTVQTTPSGAYPRRLFYSDGGVGNPIEAEVAFDPDSRQIVAVHTITLRLLDGSVLVDGDYPTEGQRVDIAVQYIGPPSETTPLYIEHDDDGVTRLTAGRLLQKAYDGEYSARDPITGDIVPTGIRYDADALLLMTDLVRLRITEAVDDLRDWAEKTIYAPTGWAPSLDADLRISPSSQAIPESFDGLPVLDDNNVEPVPTWNAGETIINVLDFSYERWYIKDASGPGPNADSLGKRDVSIEYRSASSITRKEERASFDGSAFASVGSADGEALESDVAAALALDRKLYVFERYNTGAQTIEVPVRRADDTALLRAGSWVIVDLSWLPDYVLRRRGALWGGQIVAIHDIDCTWRILLIEEAVPLAPTS